MIKDKKKIVQVYTFVSSTESMATPAIPTSPNTRGLSESYLKQIARYHITKETPYTATC